MLKERTIMSEQNTDLMARLEQLETSNRRLKRWGGGLLAVVAAIGLTSMASSMCDTVWAERFVLKDARGSKRLMMDAYGTDAPYIAFFDTKGKTQAKLAMTNSGNATLDIFKSGVKSSADLRFSEEGGLFWEVAKADSCKAKSASSCEKKDAGVN
jgi:hypothetical protein